MNSEQNRINSFGSWPSSAVVESLCLAKAGFYYTGRGVEVQCFSCGGKISEWSCGDQVMARHRRLDPGCPFLVDSVASGNVPLDLDGPHTEAPAGSRGPDHSSDGADSLDTERTTQEVENYRNGTLRLLSFMRWHSMAQPQQPSHHFHARPDPDEPAGPQPPDSSTEGSNPLALDTDSSPNREDDIYRNDALRLLSFINWPVPFISRESLVSAGFYHAGGGRVRCAWCGGELQGGWRHGDRPLDHHRRHFPHCQYARHAGSADNSNRSQRRVMSDVPSQPETPLLGSPHADEVQPQTEAVEHNWRVLEALEGIGWRGLGVVGGGTEGARHPARASLASRLATFAGWPPALRQTPALLAEAGFYYTGSDDQVRCFYCDGGLGKWEPNDAPWSEHARWFPECGYVQLVKGREYTERCRSRNAHVRQPSSAVQVNAPQRPVSAGSRVQFPITESQVESEMESAAALAVLGTGVGAERVRSAIRRRLASTGTPFTSSEALIDAALHEQLSEEGWGTSPAPVSADQRLARDILAFTNLSDIWEGRATSPGPEAPVSPADSLNHPHPPASPPAAAAATAAGTAPPAPAPPAAPAPPVPFSLEEENRQLKEARLCKVCMDCEVSVVFLPCGHLVTCGACGASLTACPLCRASVRALVRAYLA